jgi:amino-acid N-acetyltransferase
MRVRRAILPDAEAICELIRAFSQTDTLLPRSLPEICENVRDFAVAELNDEIIGCGALHLYGVHLAEIRSIAVLPKAQGLGAGRALVDALLSEAEYHHVTGVCLFTRIPDFFSHMGFSIARREELPDKINKDCLGCPKLNACDEIAMVRGELPAYSILEQPHNGLIQIRHEEDYGPTRYS